MADPILLRRRLIRKGLLALAALLLVLVASTPPAKAAARAFDCYDDDYSCTQECYYVYGDPSSCDDPYGVAACNLTYSGCNSSCSSADATCHTGCGSDSTCNDNCEITYGQCGIQCNTAATACLAQVNDLVNICKAGLAYNNTVCGDVCFDTFEECEGW